MPPELDGEGAEMRFEGKIEIAAWGLEPTYHLEREYAFLTGPDDRPDDSSYPSNMLSLGTILKNAIDQVAPMREGPWVKPRFFRIRVEETEAVDITDVVMEQATTLPLRNPQMRNHLRMGQDAALEAFREGDVSHREVRESIRAASDARTIDLLELVMTQVQTMQLRYMGRHTSYYIDKYEVMRLIEQLIEDIARGKTGIEHALRTNNQPAETPEARWLTRPAAVSKAAQQGRPRGRQPRAEGA